MEFELEYKTKRAKQEGREEGWKTKQITTRIGYKKGLTTITTWIGYKKGLTTITTRIGYKKGLDR
ncbi:MAG: hypothetical protein DRR19_12010 [Candidatus Parabeggiatoa sp. nov. 1]|nr:MAG: hypothetical protein DRR19_12010 [Gammaproteobacteria bacterium]